ncbi:folylpolyglutamate synthase [Kalmusia sp. IMI 367209]|nr:folylpolyglutamate synthase [Kalmusia sp. IMI 367209]
MIQPGLERIGRLLQNVQFPWKAIHVAGTNGKGSICGYASTLLTRGLISNGRFTSPHIVNRWDCITINNQAVSEQEFRRVENHFIKLNEQENINASEFELLTATAFQLFTEQKIDVGIIEVGMGGRLDSTNILENQIVSVISKIAHDHQGFLGNTIEEIALHKAGILRPNVPFIVNPLNQWNVHEVIENYAKEIGAGPRILLDTVELQRELFSTKDWHQFAESKLPFQRDNALLAYLAYLEVLKSLGLGTRNATQLLVDVKNTQPLPGRLQKVLCPVVFGREDRREILVDGAHNPDAAQALLAYVNQKFNVSPPTRLEAAIRHPITWVLAMTQGKDAREYLKILLRPGDSVVTTSFGPIDGMPWVKSMGSEELLKVAKEVVPGITGLAVSKRGVYRALCAAKYLATSTHIVLTGSLYLVGDFFREHEIASEALREAAKEESRAGAEGNIDHIYNIGQIDQEEKRRVTAFLAQNA